MMAILSGRSLRVSLVIGVIDAFTGKAAGDHSVDVSLDGSIERPIRKPGGLFVFVNLAAQRYTVRVRSALHFEETLDVEPASLDAANPLLFAALMPRPLYPFPANATLVRCQVRGVDGRPTIGATISAEVLTPSCARGRLRREAAAGSASLLLGSLTGPVAPGDVFALQGSGEAAAQLCVAASFEPPDALALRAPLEQTCARGTALTPVVRTRSDERGEAVLWFRGLRAEKLDIRLLVSNGDVSQERELTLFEGRALSIGAMDLN